MRKSAGFLVAGLALAAVESIQPVLAQTGPNLDDMFLENDADTFDPGLPIGTRFPAIRALYQGEEITDIDQFIGDKGAVFIANRSVDW
jgi:hypothetical protein